jgi:type I restriction enzyme S subunit
MKLETFFEKFDQFADAPNALPKMRELVLDLAVNGKLTDRDLEKESVASEYSDEPSSDILPANWRLLNFGKFCDIQGGNQPPKSHFSDEPRPGYVRMFQIRDLGERPVPVYISKESTNRFCREGEILIGRYGASVGKVFWAQDGAYNVALAKFIFPEDALLPAFAFWVLKSEFFQAEIAGASRSAQAGFNKGDLAAIDFPLPPLAEQKRIVAKVDELMALCDRLEEQQLEREAQAGQLARASLARFADAPTPANLNLLFHSSFPISPSDLRKSILTLAVQGKLVPQDPNDEPAQETLRRGDVDLNRWAVPPDDERQTVPDSWTWLRFAGVGEQRLGKMLDAQKNRGELKPYLRNTNVQWMRFELDDIKDMRVEQREVEELRLKAGDLLICEGGEPGRCAIWRDEVGAMYFQKAIHRVRPCEAVVSEYLAMNLQIDCANGVLAGYFTGATIKHLTGRSLAVYPVPIPPLAEQRRIVAKVSELMALVDELETQLAASRATAEKLLTAFVAELTATS